MYTKGPLRVIPMVSRGDWAIESPNGYLIARVNNKADAEAFAAAPALAECLREIVEDCLPSMSVEAGDFEDIYAKLEKARALLAELGDSHK